MRSVNSITSIGTPVTCIAPIRTYAADAACSRSTAERYTKESNDAEVLSIAD